MSETKTKKRKRPRTAQVRQDLKKVLECSILSPRSSILPLFSKNKDYMVGNLFQVIKNLMIDGGNIDKFLNLSNFALKSLNNRTKIFTIFDEENSTKKEELKIAFHRKLRTRIFETIAFVDNLPLLCTKERLWRRATLFGTVVDVHLPKPKKVFQKQGILKGSIIVEHAGYGFVQFTSPYSVKRFCKRYSANSHLRRH
uniref:Ribosomal protein S1 n=1 Tax=Panagrolaimus sp. JU765 TaxID=591449 RepID=A0AC34QCG8_9BILA